MEQQPPIPSPSNWFKDADTPIEYDDDSWQYPKLLSLVTGLSDLREPSEQDFAEADEIIMDPNMPCSDLRGVRDCQ